MTTYKSYAECKIAHPDSEIVTTTKLHSNGPEFEFLPVKFIEGYYRSQCDLKVPNVEDGIWVICNPAEYCSSLKDFLEAGFKLVEDDKFIEVVGYIYKVQSDDFDSVNKKDSQDCDRYILSAAALNGGCKIPAKAEQWTVYSNTMPLCELSDEQAAMLFNAWRKNNEILEFFVENWSNVKPKQISINGIYRIKPKSELELFIEAAVSTFDGRTGLSEYAMSLAAQLMFDSGKFKMIKDGE